MPRVEKSSNSSPRHGCRRPGFPPCQQLVLLRRLRCRRTGALFTQRWRVHLRCWSALFAPGFTFRRHVESLSQATSQSSREVSIEVGLLLWLCRNSKRRGQGVPARVFRRQERSTSAGVGRQAHATPVVYFRSVCRRNDLAGRDCVATSGPTDCF